jgi:formamidopyrimidine-DNA glycosylase
MPELPEVETVARDLRGLVVGARITGARVTWLKTLRSQDVAAFERAVVGRTIVGTSRRAKLVVLDLDGGVGADGAALPDYGAAITIHLKMTGQLFVMPAGRPEDPYLRLVVEFADGRELRFRDIRKFGRVGVSSRDPGTGDLRGELGGPRTFKGFGPEPLDPAFTVRAFGRRIRARKGRLKSLLLDQSFIAGVGNIYADEALWAARLHPLRTTGTLRPGDAGRLYRHLRRILAEAVARRGSSVDDYTAPDGDGSMQERLLVYQRAGEPCPRCGRPIRRIVLGGRSTHFCSWCQRLPAADRAGAAAILRGMEPRPGRRGNRGAGEADLPGEGLGPIRTGPRWTDIGGADGSLGTPTGSTRRAAAGARRRDEPTRDERARRASATRQAAATRRAAARASAGGAETGAQRSTGSAKTLAPTSTHDAGAAPKASGDS